MPVMPACPEPEELQSLLLGQLADPRAQLLAEHFEHCQHCCGVVKTLKAEDALVEFLRLPAPTPMPGENDMVNNLIRQVTNMWPAKTCKDQPWQTPSMDANAERYDFLAPALGPGEMGRLGPYRLLKVLGAGGMGVVFQAEDLQLDRLVALKVMKPSLAASDSARRRFVNEGRALAAIRNKHIIDVYQVGEDRDIPYLVMELLEGETLDEILDRKAEITLREVLVLGHQLAAGLAAAHARGLIHRDIKPANIWIEHTPTGVRIKILDFGLARVLGEDTRLTGSGIVLGTPSYMSPEQARGEPVDARSDLFSLGCVLYRLCTGQEPVAGKNLYNFVYSLAVDEIIPPCQLKAQVPEDVSDLIMRLLVKDQEQRNMTAQQVAEELDDIAMNLATGHSPQKPLERNPIAARPVAASRRAATTEPGDVQAAPVWRGGLSRTWLIAVSLVTAAVAVGLVIWFGAHDPFPPQPPNGVLDRLDAKDLPAEERFAWQPKELVAVLGSHKSKARQQHVAFSPDGNALAVSGGGPDAQAWLWDLRTRRLVYSWKRRDPHIGSSNIVFALGGKVVVSGGLHDYTRIWDVASGKQLAALGGANDVVYALAAAPDGKRVVASQRDYHDGPCTLRLWDLASKKVVRQFKGHTWYVPVVVFSPNGKSILSGGYDSTLRLWNVETGKERWRFDEDLKDAAVLAAAFSPDGKLAASAASLPSGKQAAAAGTCVRIRLWDSHRGRLRQRMVLPTPPRKLTVLSLAFAPDNSALAGSCEDGSILLWDVRTGKIKRQWQWPAWISDVVFAPDGHHLVTANDNGAVYVLRLKANDN